MKTLSKFLLAAAGLFLVPVLFLVTLLLRLIRPFRGQPVSALIYSQVIWDEVWQRPQQYAWRISTTYPTIYCCPVQPHNLLVLGGRWRPVKYFSEGNRTLIILSPLVFSGHFKNRFIYRINCRIAAACIRQALPPGTSAHVLLNTPFGLPVVETLFYTPARSPGLARLVYDVIDDFTVFDWSPPFGPELDHRLTSLADEVITGTNELSLLRPPAEFIACGVDYAQFATPAHPPPDIASLPKPIVGYFGTISERVDLDLIASVAAALPAASIVLVGPVHLPAHSLPRAANIHYLGLRRHTELPAYAQAFTVGLIPFRITSATVKLNPVKTLEYLAAGLPVVATRLPDLQQFYSHVVHIADSPAEFVEAVKSLLTTADPARQALGRQMAKESSWDTMTEKINRKLFPGDTGSEDNTKILPSDL